MWPRLILVLALSAPQAASAQNAEIRRYLPLEVGNAWKYWQPPHSPDVQGDTLWRGTSSISETVSISDTTYLIVDHPFSLADTLREDSLGRIWARQGDREALLFDFAMEEGETYEFQPSKSPDLEMQVSIARNRTIEVAAGEYRDCVVLTFDDPDALDEGRIYAFAPGIGILWAYDGMGDYEELFTAWSDGAVITSIDRVYPERPEVSISAYPNPVASTSTITLSGIRAREVHAHLYDLRGGTTATLFEGLCAADPCSFTWDVAGLANGQYFVRITGDGWSRTIPLTIMR